MSVKTLAPLTLGLFLATAALAHDGVKNPAVKARMEAMGLIGANTKILGQMAKGEIAFDADKARAAAATIAEQAERAPALFEANETDPKSEALPAIWENFADFTAKAGALQMATTTAAQAIAGPADLGPQLGQIGGTCKACHSKYRE